MKKYLVAFFAAVILLLPQTGHAREISRDKFMHIGASAAVEWYMAHNKPFCKWTRAQRVVANVAVVGGGKEWYDSKHPENHSADWNDIAADTVGAISAEGIVWLYKASF